MSCPRGRVLLFRVWGLGFRAWGLGIWVWGLGFRVFGDRRVTGVEEGIQEDTELLA